MNTLFPSNKRAWTTVLAALALGACAGALGSGVSVSRNDVAPGYQPEELYVVATGDNQLRTRILGEPFDMPRSAFESAVLASLKGQNFGPRLNLSTNPQREDARQRQVVIAFNLADTTRAARLCANSAESFTAARSGGPLTVTGVYCAGGDGGYLTQATARAGNVAGPDTPQFRQLMSQLAIALFPDENPRRQLDEGTPPVVVSP